MAHKPKRGAPTIDMTAMVDVAFLLLTFFILTTTKFREDQSVEVDSPSSISETQLPEEKIMTISINNEGGVFVGFSDLPTRGKALMKAAREQQWNITSKDSVFFTSLQDFGMPFDKMEAWLKSEDRELEHPGVPHEVTDTVTQTGNELKDWIRYGRLSDPGMRIAIRGDVDAKYETVSQVISTLQDWKINLFSLITNLEDPPEGYVSKKGHSKGSH